jgi:hypothetical protein
MRCRSSLTRGRSLSAAARPAAGWRCCWRCAIGRRFAGCCGGASPGAYAAQRLPLNYYTQYVELARQGGMAAVCGSEHFAGQRRQPGESRPADDD